MAVIGDVSRIYGIAYHAVKDNLMSITVKSEHRGYVLGRGGRTMRYQRSKGVELH